MSGVLVIAEQRRGELRPQSLELVTAAQAVRREGDAVSVAIIGAAPDAFIPSLSLAGIDEIVTIKVAAAEFDPETVEGAVAALIAQRKPDVVLIPHSVDESVRADATQRRRLRNEVEHSRQLPMRLAHAALVPAILGHYDRNAR